MPEVRAAPVPDDVAAAIAAEPANGPLSQKACDAAATRAGPLPFACFDEVNGGVIAVDGESRGVQRLWVDASRDRVEYTRFSATP